MNEPAPEPLLPLLAPADLDPAQRALHARIAGGTRSRSSAIVPVTDARGRLAGPFNALLFAPDVGDALQEVGSRIRSGLSLPDRERELATLLVAGHAGSSYELSAHRLLAAAAGVSPAEAECAAGGRMPDLDDGHERDVIGFCAALLDGPPPAEVTRSAIARLGPRAVVELVVLVGYYQLLARLLGVAGVGGTGAGGTGAGGTGAGGTGAGGTGAGPA